MKRRTLSCLTAITVALGVGASLAACGSAAEEPKDESSQPIPVAVYNQYPPSQYVKDGQLTGWMVELLGPLAERSGLNFQLNQVSNFSTLIPGLQSGRFDIAASNITVTNERMKTLDFVTTNSVGTGFATRQGDDRTIAKATDVCGLQVSALTGSVYEPQLRSINDECGASGLESATVSLYPDTGAALLAVQNGRAEAVIAGYTELAFASREGSGMTLQSYQFAKLPEAIGFPKDSPYTQPIMEAMNELIADGTYRKILDSYGMSAIAITQSELNPAFD